MDSPLAPSFTAQLIVSVMNPAQVSGTRVQKQLDLVTQVVIVKLNNNVKQNAIRIALITLLLTLN